MVLSTTGLQFFQHIFLLLFLIHYCQIQVIGSSHPVTVTVGDDVILPCHLKPASDASAMTFEWARTDLKPRFVHVWHEGQDLHVNQHSAFKGRTSVDIRKLKNGDISLMLSRVKLSDRGTYRCYFPDLDKASAVQLVVGSASLPGVSLAGIDRSISGVVLQCESAGWYPEPELLWLDAEGNLLSAGPTETLRGPDDLYTVSSRVTVEKRHSNNITCRATMIFCYSVSVLLSCFSLLYLVVCSFVLLYSSDCVSYSSVSQLLLGDLFSYLCIQDSPFILSVLFPYLGPSVLSFTSHCFLV
uniref:Ig-like domain-containing protein n=1 Tax=Amphilophus citrinellus TaxID=61819 RepID=A0A3Q0R7Q1_AMPCI